MDYYTSFALGFFAFHWIPTLLVIRFPPFIIHHIVLNICCLVFYKVRLRLPCRSRPVQGNGAIFYVAFGLINEGSVPFVNIRWFIKKFGDARLLSHPMSSSAGFGHTWLMRWTMGAIGMSLVVFRVLPQFYLLYGCWVSTEDTSDISASMRCGSPSAAVMSSLQRRVLVHVRALYRRQRALVHPGR